MNDFHYGCFILFFIKLTFAIATSSILRNSVIGVEDVQRRIMNTNNEIAQDVDVDAEAFAYADVCESEATFQKVSTGWNPDSRLVHVHPDTWIYVTECRHPDAPCEGFAAGSSVCRTKKSWIQVYGRLDDAARWQFHWIAVDSACSCAVKLFPFHSKNRR